MPPTLKVRSSYQQDAAFLLKLCDAIERDPDVTPERKLSIITKLQDISSELARLKSIGGGAKAFKSAAR